MTGKRPTGVFVTGTNTGVGKTMVAAALARTLVANGCKVGVYKPVLSGCSEEPTDTTISANANALDWADDSTADDDVRLWRAAGCPGNLSDVSPQRFRTPLVPHLAAQAEGRTVDSRLLRTGLQRWRDCSDMVIVEGAGGLFSPVTESELNADLAREFNFPVLLVAANTLGVIHATLATLFAARAYRGGLNIAAVVLNEVPHSNSDVSRGSNLGELRNRCAPCPVLPHGLDEVQIANLDCWPEFHWLTNETRSPSLTLRTSDLP